MRAGLRHIAATPILRIVGLGFFAVVVFNGIDDIALVFLAKGPLHGGASTVGLLSAAAGIGLFLGYALLAKSPRRISTGLLLVGGSP